MAVGPSAPLLQPIVTAAGRRLIIRAEGYSDVPYICAGGVVTIGYGSTFDWTGNPITMDNAPMNRLLAGALFRRDLSIFSKTVRIFVKAPVNANQFSALVSLTYNIGAGNFRSSTLLRKLNRGDYDGCANEFWKWRRAKGIILKGLVIRREVERLMFVSEV